MKSFLAEKEFNNLTKSPLLRKSNMKRYFPYFVFLCIINSSCGAIEIFKENTEFRPYKDYSSFVILNKEIGQKGFSDEFLDIMLRMESIQPRKIGLAYEKKNLTNHPLCFNEDLRQKEVFYDYPFWGQNLGPMDVQSKIYVSRNTATSEIMN